MVDTMKTTTDGGMDMEMDGETHRSSLCQILYAFPNVYTSFIFIYIPVETRIVNKINKILYICFILYPIC